MDALNAREQQPAISSQMRRALRWVEQQSWARVLYNHNPFYVVSAALVFWGLRSSFDTSHGTFNAWPLTLCLGAFTLLLVATAVLIIRWGKVWEDARSILLLVVLMFLGMSVTFDSILANDGTIAKWYYLGGLAFAVAVTESALRLLPLRLPALYRVPFYLIVGLFYLYPLVMTGRLNTPSDTTLQWQLFGFSTVAALIFLTLLPAVRRGAGYANDNLSPWRWPLFPWTLFGVLGLCVCLRAYYLCQSLHFVGYANSIFGGYFLAPMMLAAAVLFVEGGRVTGSQLATRAGMLLPLVTAAISGLGHRHDWVYLDFLTLFQQVTHATPLFIAVVAAIIFYAVAAVRHVHRAGDILLVSVALLTFMGPQTLTFSELHIEQTWPLALVSATQLIVGLRRWQSYRVAVGACVMLVASIIEWQGTWFTSHLAMIPLHLLLATFLFTGMLFTDDVARRLRRWSAAMMAALALLAILERSGTFADLPPWLVAMHPLAIAGLAVWIGHRLRLWRFYGSASIIGVFWLGVYGTEGYTEARRHLVGLDQLAFGLFFFACAALISLAKAGVLRRWITALAAVCRKQPASPG